MPPEENNPGSPTGGQAPGNTNPGQAGQGDAHSQSQLPDKYKGKSAEELAKMHSEAEKKMGEMSQEVADARKSREDVLKLQADAVKARETLQELTELIYSDPERMKAVESWYAKKNGQPGVQQQNGQNSSPGISQPSSQSQPLVDDTRRALQDQIFDEFYARVGIDKLPQKEKQEALQKVSSEFADLFDPTGKKTISQIVAERPLVSLRRDLDKAYKLSGFNGQGGNQQSTLAQEQNNQAAIGSMGGATIREDQVTLTANEQEMARHLGISPDKYLAQKKQILKERGSVN